MIKKRHAKHIRTYLDSSRIRQRRKKKRVLLYLSLSMALIAGGYGCISFLHADSFQFAKADISGNKILSSKDIEQTVHSIIESDSHAFGLIPNTSTLFIDDEQIEEQLMQSYPRIKTVDVKSHIGGIVTIDIDERGSFAKWCNSTACYDLDVRGYIFGESGSTASLARATSDTSSRATGAAREAVPDQQSASSHTAVDLAMRTISEVPSNESRASDSEAERSVSTQTHEQSAKNTVDPTIAVRNTYGSDTYIFKGLLDSDPVGAHFLDEAPLARIAEFLAFLRSQQKKISYIQCDSVQYCDVVLDSGAKIIIDISDELQRATERFEVALENPVLARDAYEYVDLRYGNKIFFKVAGEKEKVTSTEARASSAKNTTVTTGDTSSRSVSSPASDLPVTHTVDDARLR